MKKIFLSLLPVAAIAILALRSVSDPLADRFILAQARSKNERYFRKRSFF